MMEEYPMWYITELIEEKSRKYYTDKYYSLLNAGLADGAEMGMVPYGTPPQSSGNNYHTKPDNAYKQLRYYERLAWPERFGDAALEAIAKKEQRKVSALAAGWRMANGGG